MMGPNRYPTEEEFNKWIAALESGEYKKGYHRLYDPASKSFCCLGVATDLFDIAPPGYYALATFRGEPYILPENLQRNIAGVNDSSQTFEAVVKKLKDWVQEGRIKFGKNF